MTVRTVVWTRNVTAPGTYTETETEYIVTPPGFVDDPSTLPMNVGLIGNTLPSDAFIGFRGFDATTIGKTAFNRSIGCNSKWIGRVVDGTTLNDNKIRLGSTRYAGNGVSTECRVGLYETLRFAELENMSNTLNRLSVRIFNPSNPINESFSLATSKIVTKPSGEFWLTSYVIYEKIISGVTSYSTSGTLAGFDSVKIIGVSLVTAGTGTTSATIEINSGGDIYSSGVNASPRSWASIGNTVTFNGPPAAVMVAGGFVCTSIDGLTFGPYAASRPINIGPLVSFIAPNTYIAWKSPAIPKETIEAQFRSAIGIREFHLFCIPGFGMDPSAFLIGNGYGNKYTLKTLDRSLSNMRPSLLFGVNGVSSLDREYNTRAYVRAPILVGSVDGGDIALDVTLPAPFGDCRIVWSPVRRASAIYNVSRSLTNANQDQTIEERLAEAVSSIYNYNLLREFGAVIYEPTLIEKIATTAAIPTNYVSNPKRRPLGRVRAGEEPCAFLYGQNNRTYGGGAWNPWIGGFIDLSTLPSSVDVILVIQLSGINPVPASPITIGWALWDAPTEAYVLTGSTSNLTLIETGTPTVNTARFSGTMPTPPSGNRQAHVRAQIIAPGLFSVTGANFNTRSQVIVSATFGYFTLFSETRSTRRRMWPYMISKNKIIGSDASVFEAENVGCIWTDASPLPIVTYSSDFVVTWSGQQVLFTGCPIWTVTNRASSTECRSLETKFYLGRYNLPSYIFYRVKISGTSSYLVSSTTAMFGDSPQWFSGIIGSNNNFSISALNWRTIALGTLQSGTVLQIEVRCHVNWFGYYDDNNSTGTFAVQSPATIFNKTYTMTVP